MLDLALEIGAGQWRPPALAANLVAHPLVVDEQILPGLRIGLADEAVRMHAQWQLVLTHLFERSTVEIGKRHEALRVPANDRQHHRHAVARRTDHRLRSGADTDPGHEPTRLRLRIDTLILERRPHRALPCYGPLRQDRREQVELFVEQLVILVEIEAEQRKRLDEGAAP